MPPILVDIVFMPLVELWIVWCNLPISLPGSSITLTRQQLYAYLSAEPWQTFETSTSNQFFSIKPPMTSSCHLQKGTVEICVSTRIDPTESLHGFQWNKQEINPIV